MTHPVRIIAIKKQPPELDRFVAALLAFTIAELEAEKIAKADVTEPKREAEA